MSFCHCSSGYRTSKSISAQFIGIRWQSFYLIGPKLKSLRLVLPSVLRIMSMMTFLTDAPFRAIGFFSCKHLPPSNSKAALHTARASFLCWEQLPWPNLALIRYCESCIPRTAARGAFPASQVSSVVASLPRFLFLLHLSAKYDSWIHPPLLIRQNTTFLTV